MLNKNILFLGLTILLGLSCQTQQEETLEKAPPNVVIIFLDDSGYSDFEPFGQETFKTPGVTELAAEGCTYTNFYVPQAICSASRAALLTGSYPGRTKVFSAHPPKARGLDTIYPTMGEIFQAGGYSTAVFGKWHCGDQEDTRPHNRGFDESCGLMYSNDMWKYHPENPEYWGQYPLQFWENGQVTIEDVTDKEQAYLTKWYTEHAVDFIQRNKDNPFLLYVPHSMPHVPIFASEEFQGKSGLGLYADVMLEIDWSVQQINQALKDNGLEDNTVVILTSDNGPWVSYGNHAGTTPFREAKGTSFDGGIRSACIIKYPPNIKAGSTSDRTFFTIDLLPSLAHLAGIELPEQAIDGHNLWNYIWGDPRAKNTHEYYAFSNNRNFEGVMSGDGHWKMHLPHNYRTLDTDGGDGIPGKYRQEKTDTVLYHLHVDPMESANLWKKVPTMSQQMLSYAIEHKEKFYKKE